MDHLDEIIQRLKTIEGDYLKEEVETLIQNKEEAIPKLLAAMEDVYENYENYYDSHLQQYASFILAHLRVKDFFPLFTKIVQLPEDELGLLFGDTITETLPRLLAAVYDGNLELLKELIEKPDTAESVKGKAMASLVILVLEGELDRKEAIDYLKDFLVRRGKEEDLLINGYCINSLTDLYPKEAMEEIEWAFKNNLVDEFYIGLEDVKKQLAIGETASLASLKEKRDFQLIGPLHKEMEWWACFDGIPRSSGESIAKDVMEKLNIKPSKKIGRNAPCPCGSGKKYKKCCG